MKRFEHNSDADRPADDDGPPSAGEAPRYSATDSPRDTTLDSLLDTTLDTTLDTAIEVALGEVFGAAQPSPRLADRIFQAWRASEEARAGQVALQVPARLDGAIASAVSGEVKFGTDGGVKGHELAAPHVASPIASQIASQGAEDSARSEATSGNDRRLPSIGSPSDLSQRVSSFMPAAGNLASRHVPSPTPNHAIALAASLAVVIVGATAVGFLVSSGGTSADVRTPLVVVAAQTLSGDAGVAGVAADVRGDAIGNAGNGGAQRLDGTASANGIGIGIGIGQPSPVDALSKANGRSGAPPFSGNRIATSGIPRTLAGKAIDRSSASVPGRSPTGGAVNSLAGSSTGDARRGVEPELDTERRGPWGEHEIIAWVNTRLERSWHEASVTPAARAGDEDWCRRLFIRVLGRIPTVGEVREFVAEPSADKREQWAQRLTASDSVYAAEFAAHWADFWTTVLVGMDTTDAVGRGVAARDCGGPGSREQLAAYLAGRIRERQSFDRLAVELLTAQGSNCATAADFNPAVNFLMAYADGDGQRATERVSRVFLGRNLQCVRCHADATASTADEAENALRQYRELSDVLRSLRVARLASGGERLEEGAATGDAEAPAVSPAVVASSARQVRVGQIVSSREFSQAIVNRVWCHFLGYGLVNPVDEIHPGSPSAHPELLGMLSERFREHGYDFAALTRWVALSEAFGRSSYSGGEESLDAPERGRAPLFSRYYARPMRVEQLYESLRLLASEFSFGGTGGPAANLDGAAPAIGGTTVRGAGNMPGREKDDGQRRAFFTAVASQREPVSAGESLLDDPQAIIELVPRWLITADAELPRRVFGAAQESLVSRVVADAKLELDQKVVHLFQAAVARLPSPVEAQAARDLVGSSPMDPAIGLRDLWWALLNSNEFLLDH